MGAFAIVIFSAIVFAFSGLYISSTPNFTKLQKMKLSVPMYEFRIPERKAILTDSRGEAQRTADGTQMTKRDRGEKLAFYHAPQIVSTPEPVKAAIPTPIQDQTTEASVTVPERPIADNMTEAPSLDELVFAAIEKDPDISLFSRRTVQVKLQHGMVMLNGEVLDEADKMRILKHAYEYASAGNVEDRLVIVQASPSATTT